MTKEQKKEYYSVIKQALERKYPIIIKDPQSLGLSEDIVNSKIAEAISLLKGEGLPQDSDTLKELADKIVANAVNDSTVLVEAKAYTDEKIANLQTTITVPTQAEINAIFKGAIYEIPFDETENRVFRVEGETIVAAPAGAHMVHGGDMDGSIEPIPTYNEFTLIQRIRVNSDILDFFYVNRLRIYYNINTNELIVKDYKNGNTPAINITPYNKLNHIELFGTYTCSCTFSYQSKTIKLFVDGVLIDTLTWTDHIDSQIVANTETSYKCYSPDFSNEHITLYSVVLSDSSVKQLTGGN